MGLPSFLKEKKFLIIIIVVVVILAGVAAFLFLGEGPYEEEEALVSTRITIQAPEVPVQTEEITPEKEGKVTIPVKAAKVPVKPSAAEPKEVKREATKAEVKPAPAKEKQPSYKPWVISVASFSTKAQADELKSALKQGGYNVYSTEFFKDGVKWHRVRVGFYKSEAEAKRVAAKIEGSYNLARPWTTQPTRAEAAKYMK